MSYSNLNFPPQIVNYSILIGLGTFTAVNTGTAPISLTTPVEPGLSWNFLATPAVVNGANAGVLNGSVVNGPVIPATRGVYQTAAGTFVYNGGTASVADTSSYTIILLPNQNIGLSPAVVS